MMLHPEIVSIRRKLVNYLPERQKWATLRPLWHLSPFCGAGGYIWISGVWSCLRLQNRQNDMARIRKPWSREWKCQRFLYIIIIWLHRHNVLVLMFFLFALLLILYIIGNIKTDIEQSMLSHLKVQFHSK